MRDDTLPRPTRDDIRQHLLTSLYQYWERESGSISSLPVAEFEFPDCNSALRLKSVTLPDWAESCGVSGCLLVPAEACTENLDWRRVDWWLAAFLLLESWHERVHEQRNGPIHSYSFRLKGWDERVWRHAWVNRIAIFLRLWAADLQGTDVISLFGPIPDATIIMTHDVDAVKKTLPIRMKQGGFNLLNAARQLGHRRWVDAGHSLHRAARFFFGREDWWLFDDLLAIEESSGFRSRFHFYADDRTKTPIRWLFDPGYDVRSDWLRDLINRLDAGGWQTGLHQSFDAWQSAALIRDQKNLLDSVSPSPIKRCRQHWLRFSWRDTWAVQNAAGLEEDTTLMFNDRMGFRTATALSWKPWNSATGCAHGLVATPTVLMDSHTYDYRPLSNEDRRKEFRHWMTEIRDVGGHCAILWHPHTLAADFGWKKGFLDCINIASELELCAEL